MAADLGLLSLNQHPKLAQSQQHSTDLTQGLWMWNPKQAQDDDDSWEVRAFAQDTGNILGATWPPRSYTCTFCKREFRSAQALGGHMNVHRRDRAKLRQSPPTSTADPSLMSPSSSALLFPGQEFVASGGLCLVYSLPSSNSVFNSNPLNGYMESPSTLLTISPYEANTLVSSSYTPTTTTVDGSLHQADKLEPTVSVSDNSKNKRRRFNISNINKNEAEDELDLELRLGTKALPPQQ